MGATAVLHGHRHVSEERKPAGTRFTIFAAPSFTLGCKSGDAPSYWRIELGEHVSAERVYVGAPAVDGEDGEAEAEGILGLTASDAGDSSAVLPSDDD